VVTQFALDSNCFEVKSKFDVKDALVLCGCPFEPASKATAASWVREITKFRDNCPATDGKAIDLTESSHVKMQIGGETLEVSGASLKQLAKKSVESKA